MGRSAGDTMPPIPPRRLTSQSSAPSRLAAFHSMPLVASAAPGMPSELRCLASKFPGYVMFWIVRAVGTLVPSHRIGG